MKIILKYKLICCSKNLELIASDKLLLRNSNLNNHFIPN